MKLSQAPSAVMGYRGWQQPKRLATIIAALETKLNASTVDLTPSIISATKAQAGAFQRPYDSRDFPDLVGCVFGVERGEVAVLVRSTEGKPKGVAVLKRGNVRRRTMSDLVHKIGATIFA